MFWTILDNFERSILKGVQRRTSAVDIGMFDRSICDAANMENRYSSVVFQAGILDIKNALFVTENMHQRLKKSALHQQLIIRFAPLDSTNYLRKR
jgi:hypothetical protein